MQPITHQTPVQEYYRQFERIAVKYQPYQARVAAVLVVVCAVAAFLYGIFLLEAVGQAAARTSAERQIHELSTQLSVLEGQYLAATKELTPERAKADGYVAPTSVSTILVDKASLSFVGH